MKDILYTPEEISKILKLSKYTVYEMVKRGDIEAHHIGRSIRISQTQLDLYMMGTRKAENVFTAEIVVEGDAQIALSHGIRFFVNTDLEGEVKISIPPEDIILSAGKFVSSARNMHKGKVVDIISDEKNSKVLLDIGVPLLSIITNKSALEMNIKKGDELYAVFVN